MEFVKAQEVHYVSNSPNCGVTEYSFKDKDINTALVKISGRYPEKDYSINHVCKIMAFVLEGKGSVTIEDKTIELLPYDMVLISPGEKYYWDGKMTILVPSTPTWYFEQYELVE
ncbi:MAG: hypothetical protein JHC93_08165 [Parachlamydiales bacterium]|nr:hypothetical protein [Parachlamydiales bacterium]